MGPDAGLGNSGLEKKYLSGGNLESTRCMIFCVFLTQGNSQDGKSFVRLALFSHDITSWFVEYSN